MSHATAKALGLEFLQAFWSGEFDKAYALCASDASWVFQTSLHNPREATVGEAVRWLSDTLMLGFDTASGYAVTLRDAIGEQGEAAIEYSATGRTRRGETYLNHYVVRFSVAEGKITSIRPYFDTHYASKMLHDLG
jgi:ketosteroid isomerase-like protein